MQPPPRAYPSATPYTAYVPILDGVAARLRLSNAASGDSYVNGVANGALVTSLALLAVGAQLTGTQAIAAGPLAGRRA